MKTLMVLTILEQITFLHTPHVVNLCLHSIPAEYSPLFFFFFSIIPLFPMGSGGHSSEIQLRKNAMYDITIMSEGTSTMLELVPFRSGKLEHRNVK